MSVIKKEITYGLFQRGPRINDNKSILTNFLSFYQTQKNIFK